MRETVKSLLDRHGIPFTFVREHDVLLLAAPFSPIGAIHPWSEAHTQRFAEVCERRYIRSALELGHGDLEEELASCCTPTLQYRFDDGFFASGPNSHGEHLLLACAPHAHLALANLLERGGLFTADAIGRVAAA